MKIPSNCCNRTPYMIHILLIADRYFYYTVRLYKICMLPVDNEIKKVVSISTRYILYL